jgi:hypothetical protein
MERRFFVKTINGITCRKYIEIDDYGVVKEIKEMPSGDVLERIYTMKSRLGTNPSSIAPQQPKKTWKQQIDPRHIGNAINKFLQDDTLTR